MVVVGSIAQAVAVDWMYETPKIDDVVSTVSVSFDGTCVLMVNESAITYFKNQRQRMDYNFNQIKNLPIGS